MIETVKFALAACPSCGPNALVAGALDERDELVSVCARCGAPLPRGAAVREVGARLMERYGYDVEGEIERLGCGSSSGSSCSGGCCSH